MSRVKKVAFSGSRREYPGKSELVKAWFDSLNVIRCDVEYADILVGDCPTGVDLAVREHWKCTSEGYITPTVYIAQWDQMGKAAGPIRNQKMIDDADILIAMPCEQSKGTWDAIRKAVKKGIPVLIFPL